VAARAIALDVIFDALCARVIGGAGAVMVRLSTAVPVPPALTALKLTFKEPTVVGVPEIRPVPVLTDSPAGKPLTA
jgi:hypothetical protein